MSVGAVVGPDTAITTLDNIDPIKVAFAVPETALAQLAPARWSRRRVRPIPPPPSSARSGSSTPASTCPRAR
ncbi:hypothetical protein ACFQ4K_22955 [Tistrella bauzanensis]